jgi:hypothetical protein
LSPVIVLQRKLLSLLSWSCKSLHIERWFCLRPSFSRGGTKFAAFGHMFKCSFKMHWHLLYYRPRMLRTSAWQYSGQIICMFTVLSPSVAMITIQRFVFYPYCYHRRLC